MNPILVTISGGIAALLVGFIMQTITRRMKQKQQQSWKTSSLKMDKQWKNYYEGFKLDLEEGVDNYALSPNDLIANYEPIWNHLVTNLSVPLTKSDIEGEVNKKFDELKKRLEEIENRFPKEATLEKIASVNYAILGTSIEALSGSVKRIEEKLLTKWDVAKIVFQILGVLSFLLGIIFAIIKYCIGG